MGYAVRGASNPLKGRGPYGIYTFELDRLKLTLTEWVVREENPREGRYAVILLCLCCHKIEHAGV